MKYAVAIDFGGTHMKGALVSDTGKFVCEETRLSNIPAGSAAVLENMAKLIADLAKESPRPISGVGIGCPGPLSIEKGTVYGSPNLHGWTEVPIVSILEKYTGHKVFLDNDANCAALGEYQFGVATGMNPLIMLTFGTGIGGGIVLDGQIFHGLRDGAAELGHFIIDKNGPVCACGLVGCFEAHCSASAVARRAREARTQNPKTFLHEFEPLESKHVSEAAERGDALAAQVIREVAEDMAIGIGGLVNIFNPAMVVLAGGLMRGGFHYLNIVRERVPRYCFPYNFRELKIEVSSLQDKAGIYGAAQIVFTGKERT